VCSSDLKHRTKSERDHRFAVESLKREINQANQQHEELIAKMGVQIDSQKKGILIGAEAKVENNTQSNLVLFTDGRAKCEKMSDDITILSQRLSAVEMNALAPRRRETEHKMIVTMLGRLQSIDALTRIAFSGFIDMLIKGPVKVPEQKTPPASLKPIGSRRMGSPSSNSPRRNSSRLVTPVDSRFRRRRSGFMPPTSC
jgi:hypothetical protein